MAAMTTTTIAEPKKPEQVVSTAPSPTSVATTASASAASDASSSAAAASASAASAKRHDDANANADANDGPLLERMCVNTVRAVSADQPEAASSGHPGAPMGCAPLAHVLWGETMKYSGRRPDWIDRDRFVLSNGHACALQYTMLHLTGYSVSLDDLKNFRRLGSKTPGHPEPFATDGVEVCTGPLGQGISNGVGLAIAERHLAAEFNTERHAVFDHHTYVICGDGCMQEGISSEAGSLAGHLGLGRLIVLYDDNSITIDGATDLAFTEDVCMRFRAYGWHVQTVEDVTGDLADLRAAIRAAKDDRDRPSLIKVKTDIGYGSPTKQGTEKAHGAPLGAADVAAAKESFGLPPDRSFYVPEQVAEYYKNAAAAADAKRAEWEDMFARYSEEHPDMAGEISRRFAFRLPGGIAERLPRFESGGEDHRAMATRKCSQLCLASVGPVLPELMGGSADLTGSNCTKYSNDLTDFQRDNRSGRYMRFGVREHAMVAVCNGMFAHGGIRPYCASFLMFAGYAIGAIRVSALSKFGVVFVMTHDSIGVGEDGPTHQPVEVLETLRCVPNLLVYRPADGRETAAAYSVALERHRTPTVICCTRQSVPAPLERSSSDGARRGAYAVVPEDRPALVIVATGSEVATSAEAARSLREEHGIPVRVVSMPCQEIFLEQPESYRVEVLPGDVPTMSVEAATVNGWHRFSHAQVGMDTFGLSGASKDVFRHFGFTAENVAKKGRELVDFYKSHGGKAPNLNLRPTFVNAAMNGGSH